MWKHFSMITMLEFVYNSTQLIGLGQSQPALAGSNGPPSHFMVIRVHALIAIKTADKNNQRPAQGPSQSIYAGYN